MTEGAWLSRLGRRVDHLPAGVAAGLGVATAAGVVGPLLWWGGTVTGLVAGGLGLAGAWALASRGRPVAVIEPGIGEESAELLEMIELDGGTFQMGSPQREAGRRDNEGPLHTVTVSPFALAKVPTAQRLYRQIMDEERSRPKGDDLPVNQVSFFDAVEFCNRLSKKSGLKPCYIVRGRRVKWDRTANGYRLPTEAEWEYAARAGTTSAYFFGDDESQLAEQNTHGNAEPGHIWSPW